MFLRVLFRGLHVSAGIFVRTRARSMPRTLEEFQQTLTTPPQHEGNLVKIAVIGDPNVGKSTIINKILAKEICSVSNKAHTTRISNPVAITTEDLQIVLVDTPGAVHRLHARKHRLPEDMRLAPERALQDKIDVLAAVIDCSDVHRRDYLSFEMLELLHKHRVEQSNACSILILNKVDKLRWKREVLSCIDTLCNGIVGNTKVRKKHIKDPVDIKQKIWEREERRMTQTESTVKENETEGCVSPLIQRSPKNPDPGAYKPEFPPRLESWPHFERVFIVSALQEDGIDDLKQFLSSKAKRGVWQYRKEFLTTQNPIQLTEEIVKGKLLDHLKREIPYQLRPKVKGWSTDDSGSLHADVAIECETEREVYIALGKEGKNIHRITEAVRQQMCNVFSCEVALKISVINVKAKKR